MVWGIIAALDQEIALVLEQMQIRKTVELYGSKFYIGTVRGRQVVAVCCSIGTINAAVCTSSIIREFGADVVVNVGIAGSLCPELHVLDVVVSDEVAFHDADLDIIEKYYPFRRSFSADSKLLSLCTGVLDSMPGRSFAYKVGRIASGDVFVNDRTVKERITKLLQPLCVEMEGAAIGQVAAMNGKPFLVIRTLSDNADESADQTYDDFLERAAYNSASIILSMLEQYAD